METGRLRHLVGRRVGPYEVVDRLGEGPIGVVYSAADVGSQHWRAIKVVRATILDYPGVVDRLSRAVDSVAGLSHPHVVPVYQLLVEDELHCLVSELVDSRTLAAHAASVPLERRAGDSTLRRCVRDVAAALDHAHDRGIVHADLTPANVLLRRADSRALLTDFRIASAAGVPIDGAYLSPEQCRGEAATPASDVYALAAVLWEVLTGEPPFGRGAGAVDGHLAGTPPPLPTHLPPGVGDVLARGLARAPADRHRRAGDLARAFEEAAARPRPAAASVDVPGRPRARGLPRRLVVAALVVLVAGGGTATWAGLARLASRGRVEGAPRELPAPVPGAAGEPFAVGGTRLVVRAPAPDPAGAPSPSPGVRRIAVEVEYLNAGSGPVPVSPYDWVLTDDQGTPHQVANASLPERELPAGADLRGVLSFEVPEDASGLVLHFDAPIGDATASVPLDG
jgi:hypothetical protein